MEKELQNVKREKERGSEKSKRGEIDKGKRDRDGKSEEEIKKFFNFFKRHVSHFIMSDRRKKKI